MSDTNAKIEPGSETLIETIVKPIVKICGITNYDDAKAAIDCGADALGFNFYAKSPRAIRPSEAQAIVRRLPPQTWFVGVFVNQSRPEVERIARLASLDTLQFHGDEDLAFLNGWEEWKIIKALRIGPEESAEHIRNNAHLDPYLAIADFLLFDSFEKGSFGGTGKEISLSKLSRHTDPRIWNKAFLSGGLTPENVAAKIQQLNPRGVDVASGVELYPGKKDIKKIKAFIDAVKS